MFRFVALPKERRFHHFLLSCSFPRMFEQLLLFWLKKERTYCTTSWIRPYTVFVMSFESDKYKKILTLARNVRLAGETLAGGTTLY
jgi:hypothetical protein